MDQSSSKARLCYALSLILLSMGVICASRASANEYELSIYVGTPFIVWATLIGSITFAIVGSNLAMNRIDRLFGIINTACGTAAISGIPFFRYYYFGIHDSLRHLGTLTDVKRGVIALEEFIYPGMFYLVDVSTTVTGLPTPNMLLALPPLFVMLFVIAIVACGRRVDRTISPAAALLCTVPLYFLFPVQLPRLVPIPSTLGLLFLPVMLLLFLLLLDDPQWGVQVAFHVAFGSLLLLHPQQSLIFVVFAIGFLIVLNLMRRILTTGGGSEVELKFIGENVIALTISIAVLILVYRLILLNGFTDALVILISGLIETGGGPSLPSSSELSAAGIDLVSIVFKQLAAKVIFGLFIVGGVMVTLYRVLTTSASQNDLRYLSLIGGTVTMFGLFGLFSAIGELVQALRYVALLFIVGSIVGGRQIKAIAGRTTIHHRRSIVHVTLAVIVVVALLTSVPVMYRSPTVGQPTEHVTQSTLEGVELTTNYVSDDPFLDTRITWHHMRSAIIGKSTSKYGYVGYEPIRDTLSPVNSTKNTAPMQSFAPDHFANQSLSTVVDQETYLIVTSYDKQTYLNLYDGYRFNKSDFRYLEQSPQIGKVVTTGEYDLYRVTPSINTSQSEPS